MCGRFLFDGDFDEVYKKFMIYEHDFVVNKRDFRPTDKAPVIISKNGQNSVKEMKWGLSGREKGQILINARRETLFQKPRYAQITENRCLIPATQFFEPEQRGKEKIMHTFGTGEILYLAGVFENNIEIPTFTIITMDSVGDVKTYHPRMPVALNSDSFANWLTGSKETAQIELSSQEPNYKIMDETIQLKFF